MKIANDMAARIAIAYKRVQEKADSLGLQIDPAYLGGSTPEEVGNTVRREMEKASSLRELKEILRDARDAEDNLVNLTTDLEYFTRRDDPPETDT